MGLAGSLAELRVDLSPAVQSQIPLGYLRNGQLTIDQTGQVIPFSGTFRLPFSLVDTTGHKRDFYLGADGTPVSIKPHERDLGFPLVRLEVTFRAIAIVDRALQLRPGHPSAAGGSSNSLGSGYDS